MLAKRLTELEQAGVVRSEPKPTGRGCFYALTEAGEDLADVIRALGTWGERWVEVTTVHADPGFALWAWCQAQLDRSRLPEGRVVVAFVFPDQPSGNRYYWLLVEHGDADVCYSDPGGEPDLLVEAESLAFVDWHRGGASLVRGSPREPDHPERFQGCRPLSTAVEPSRSGCSPNLIRTHARFTRRVAVGDARRHQASGSAELSDPSRTSITKVGASAGGAPQPL